MTNRQIALESWRLFVVMLITGIIYGVSFAFIDPSPDAQYAAPGTWLSHSFYLGVNAAARVWHLFAALACVTYPIFASMCDQKHLGKLRWGLLCLLVTPGYNLLVFVASHGLTYARGVSLPSGPHDALAGTVNLVGVALLFWCAVPQCFSRRWETIGDPRPRH